ncbi:PREDICTED: shadow of prion protein-like [Chrysochloris asiatica]|uniref:Shadow of prion protein-like n=1 Tax=Chrysochloris asiatica TaxID=185453 RepID=A0A9B0TUT4_CHRAS|nr:PREDICTED: shadow of prion protein-like [Chrysochloris asiatica]
MRALGVPRGAGRGGARLDRGAARRESARARERENAAGYRRARGTAAGLLCSPPGAVRVPAGADAGESPQPAQLGLGAAPKSRRGDPLGRPSPPAGGLGVLAGVPGTGFGAGPLLCRVVAAAAEARTAPRRPFAEMELRF